MTCLRVAAAALSNKMKLRRASKPMHSHDAPTIRGSRAFEAMARANLLRMTPLKWRLVRALETLMRFLKPFTPPLRPFENPNEQPANILVIEYWNLGDVAILVPFLRNLRQSFPQAKISLLAKASLTYVLEGQGIVDEFIPARVPWACHFNRWRKYNPFSLDWISLARTILQLRRQRFDWAFSGRMDIRDNLLLWLIGARRRIAYGFCGGGFLLTDSVAPDLSRPHRADVWLRLLEAIGLSPDRKPSGIFLNSEELVFARSFLADCGIPPDATLVGVHPAARAASRRWGDQRFAEVARRLLSEKMDLHVLWFTDPADSAQAPALERLHSVKLPLRHFLAVLSLCRLLLCNDSGPMHLANLLAVPVVAVFGPQRPEWFGPRGPHDLVVIRPEFSCRPCWDYCIFDQPYCLRTISTEEVFESVGDALTRPRRAGSRRLAPVLETDVGLLASESESDVRRSSL